MNGSEPVERRGAESRTESRRVEEKVYALIIELVDRISSMESTQKELVKKIDKYNNVTSRITSLEEYKTQCIETSNRKRFPTMAVVGSIVGSLITAVVIKFVL